jgi:hypothetical protein
MKVIIDNALLYEIIGNMIGKGTRKKRKQPLSERQRAQRERFADASDYAKMQMTDEVRKARYRARINNAHTSAYSVALADALNPPTVKYLNTTAYLGVAGNVITIKAVDDFEVTRVLVQIKSPDGTMIEHGAAVKDKRRPFIWRYIATVMNPALYGTIVSATAYDHPGNQATLETTCEPPAQIASPSKGRVLPGSKLNAQKP